MAIRMLNHRGLFWVNNSKAAQKRLKGFVDVKHEKDYRLRFIPRDEASCIELQSDDITRYRMAIRFLKDSGFKPRLIPWTDNKVLQRIIRKDYSQKPESLSL